MTTYTALGDSITLGIGDPVRPAVPGGPRWRGWAVLLADSLDQPSLHILAASGGRAADVESTQLPRALQLRPDVASVVFGINDTLRPGFDPDGFAATAAHVVGALRAAGAEVLTMRLPDPGRMLGLPGPLARPLARRAHQLNYVMDGIADRFGTLHFDAASDPETYDRRMWAVDRLHPSERGHRLIARRFHALLAAQPVGRVRLAGHQGHRLGGAPVHRSGAPPAGHRYPRVAGRAGGACRSGHAQCRAGRTGAQRRLGPPSRP